MRVTMGFFFLSYIFSVMMSAWKSSGLILNWPPPTSCHLSDTCWENQCVSSVEHVEADPNPRCSVHNANSVLSHSWSFPQEVMLFCYTVDNRNLCMCFNNPSHWRLQFILVLITVIPSNLDIIKYGVAMYGYKNNASKMVSVTFLCILS